MGNKNAEPGRDRREPYNQPIKIYAVVPKGIGDWSQIKKEARLRLNDVRLGRAIDARVGKIIGYRRTLAGQSIEKFARQMRMSVGRLKKIEAGRERLTLSLVQRIAAALGCFLSVELV